MNCCRSKNCRIGEASNPARRRPPPPGALRQVRLVEAGTQRIQERVWASFQRWLADTDTFSSEACAEGFLCPSLVATVLHEYGLVLFDSGAPQYQYRHLLVLAQQQMPLLRPVLGIAWQLLTKWDQLQPVEHRCPGPLPEILFKAMFSLGVCWRWKGRWSALLLLAVAGIGRIGEVLAAKRSDLVLLWITSRVTM